MGGNLTARFCGVLRISKGRSGANRWMAKEIMFLALLILPIERAEIQEGSP